MSTAALVVARVEAPSTALGSRATVVEAMVAWSAPGTATHGAEVRTMLSLCGQARSKEGRRWSAAGSSMMSTTAVETFWAELAHAMTGRWAREMRRRGRGTVLVPIGAAAEAGLLMKAFEGRRSMEASMVGRTAEASMMRRRVRRRIVGGESSRYLEGVLGERRGTTVTSFTTGVVKGRRASVVAATVTEGTVHWAELEERVEGVVGGWVGRHG